MDNNFNAPNIWQDISKIDKSKQFFPFSIKKKQDKDFYTFPFEPMINIEGSNIIKKINSVGISPKGVEKTGTTKINWKQDDFKIKISLMISDVDMNKYPVRDFEIIRGFLDAKESLQVLCDPLELLNINYIVIEDYEIPFTKGENMQAFTINAISDNPEIYDLLKG